MITIDTLKNTSSDVIYKAFSNAFSDYVENIQLTKSQFREMIERRGFNAELSFGAFHEKQLVGFTLNGTGSWNGRLTAYDTGTGIIPEFRKKGIATRMFKESLPVFRSHNITQYLLEVIKTNSSAYDLYKKSGFEVTREFDYYILPKTSIQIRNNKVNENYQVQEIEQPDWVLFSSFWDFHPSWQNSIEAIQRKYSNFIILGIYDRNEFTGYGIIEKSTGDIPQFAIAPDHRRKRMGTTLMYYLLLHVEGNELKIINTRADHQPFHSFAESMALEPGPGQYEMMLQL